MRPNIMRQFLLVPLFAACGRSGDHPHTSDVVEQAPQVVVHATAARTATQPVSLLLDGTLLADEESDVTSVVAGRVREMLVERGSVVNKGDPLVRLRDVDYRLAAQAAKAQLDQARARLGIQDREPAPDPTTLPEVQAARTAMELAERTATRSVELFDHGAISQSALDEARSHAATAREQYQSSLNGARATAAALEAAQVSLAQANTSAAEATVRAPFAGEIADRKVSVGEYVSPQTQLVTLVNTDPLRMQLEVPQRYLNAIQPGQTLEVRVDAVPDRVFEGTLRYVSAAVARTSRALIVEAVVPNPDRLLRPGLFATARLMLGGAEQVTIVPERAVQTRAGVSRVFAIKDGKIQEHVVTVGEHQGSDVVLTSGLGGGEQVAIDQLDKLADGIAVTVESTEAANKG